MREGDATEGCPSSPLWYRRLTPSRTLFLSFAGTVLVGTGLLMLPLSSADGRLTGLSDALFTGTSAVCVTGLTVVDTAEHWSAFGQVVILVLIQVGGLGVMVFASFVGLAVIRRLSLRIRVTTAAEAKAGDLDAIGGLVRGVVGMSLAIEALIALVLAVRFALGYGQGIGEAVWNGVFHAISAFNNAGFALYSNSTEDFRTDPVVCLALCAAIILGGLGFPVLIQLRRHIRTPRRWNVNTRIVLAATATLLIVSTVYTTVLEWNNPATLGPLTPPGKVLAGFFQAVQTRTAGFNSVDIGGMHGSTRLGMDVLMFIGGGSAGTAGGVKVTTFTVLLLVLLTEIRGESDVNAFHRRLPRAVAAEAVSVAALAIGVVIAATATLMILTGGDLDPMLFETVSAFGTVGLSTGITPSLPVSAQLVIVLVMFIGRLGPITFASTLAFRERGLLYQHPQERPIIG